MAATRIKSQDVGDGEIQAEDLADGAVTLAKLQAIATGRLLGRDSAGSGAPEEIALGDGLAFTGGGAVQVKLLDDAPFHSGLHFFGGGLAIQVSTPTLLITESGIGVFHGPSLTATPVSGLEVHVDNVTLEAPFAVGIKDGGVSLDKLGSLTTKGDLLTHTGAAHARLEAGSDGHVLRASSAAAGGVEWAEDQGKLIYVSNSSSTPIANTTAETAYGPSYTVPAGTLTAGDVIRIHAFGLARTTGTPNLRNRLRLNGSALVAPIESAGTDSTATRWAFMCDLVVRSTGAAGRVTLAGFYAIGSLFQCVAGVTSDGGFFDGYNVIDTTAAITIDLSGQWSAAAAGNSTRMVGMSVTLHRNN